MSDYIIRKFPETSEGKAIDDAEEMIVYIINLYEQLKRDCARSTIHQGRAFLLLGRVLDGIDIVDTSVQEQNRTAKKTAKKTTKKTVESEEEE